MFNPIRNPSDLSDSTTKHCKTNKHNEQATHGEACGDARASERTAGGDRRGDHEGTPSCNTVPSNDNVENFKPLRFGIDSLYLSYRGQLLEYWDKKLNELKEIAQSEDETQQSCAQVVIGEHIFEVRDKGMPRFPYVLADNCFFIKINRKQSKTLPMAHVQISSEYLVSGGC